MKLGFGKAALLAGAAALIAPLSAMAQDVRNLDEVESDVRIYTGEVTTVPVVYTYTMPPGTALLIDVIPTEDSELDPTVTVTDLETGEVIAEDDDGGEGLASRARVFSEEGRQIEITVSAFAFFSGDETSGPFELQLRPSAYRPTPVRAVSFDSSWDGTLEPEGSHLFTITGEQGQLLEVALIADGDDLDPFLSLYEGDSAVGEPIVTNDDGGDGLNSLLRFILPETGTYTIAASPYGASSGGYTLRIGEGTFPQLQAPVQVLGLGELTAGRIGDGYEYGSIDPSEITYHLTPEAIAAIRNGSGEVTFNMTTPIFGDDDFGSGVDPFLELGFDTPLGYASLMSDDDGGEGLNSRIALDLSVIADEPGWLERLTIRASSIGGTGDFEIEMVEGMQPVEEAWVPEEPAVELAPPPPIRLSPGD